MKFFRDVPLAKPICHLNLIGSRIAMASRRSRGKRMDRSKIRRMALGMTGIAAFVTFAVMSSIKTPLEIVDATPIDSNRDNIPSPL